MMSSNGETVRDEHMLEGTGVAISIFVVLKLQHACIAISIVLKSQHANNATSNCCSQKLQRTTGIAISKKKIKKLQHTEIATFN